MQLRAGDYLSMGIRKAIDSVLNESPLPSIMLGHIKRKLREDLVKAVMEEISRNLGPVTPDILKDIKTKEENHGACSYCEAKILRPFFLTASVKVCELCFEAHCYPIREQGDPT